MASRDHLWAAFTCLLSAVSIKLVLWVYAFYRGFDEQMALLACSAALLDAAGLCLAYHSMFPVCQRGAVAAAAAPAAPAVTDERKLQHDDRKMLYEERKMQRAEAVWRGEAEMESMFMKP